MTFITWVIPFSSQNQQDYFYKITDVGLDVIDKHCLLTEIYTCLVPVSLIAW